MFPVEMFFDSGSQLNAEGAEVMTEVVAGRLTVVLHDAASAPGRHIGFRDRRCRPCPEK
jgi:hypothetical protein